MNRVSESCSCGAEIDIVTDWGVDMRKRLNEWRTNHRHDEGEPQRESSTDALVEQSGPVHPPEMQIGFSRNTEDWEDRR